MENSEGQLKKSWKTNKHWRWPYILKALQNLPCSLSHRATLKAEMESLHSGAKVQTLSSTEDTGKGCWCAASCSLRPEGRKRAGPTQTMALAPDLLIHTSQTPLAADWFSAAQGEIGGHSPSVASPFSPLWYFFLPRLVLFNCPCSCSPSQFTDMTKETDAHTKPIHCESYMES